MRRALQGMEAYSSILSAELPEKTKTYTPIQHSDIVNKIREEIRDAGYIITDELYRSSNEGKIALGTFKLSYKSDPEIDLCASFVNSYNKQYAFRFNLGALIKESNTAMMLNTDAMGAYKRVHKGNADMLATGKIQEFIKDSGSYWDLLLEHKQELMTRVLSDSQAYNIMGQLFFGEEILNTLQLNIVQKEMKNPSFDYKVGKDTAWSLYNHIGISLKESRPATWMTDQMKVHNAFDEVLNMTPPTVAAEIPDILPIEVDTFGTESAEFPE